MKITRSQLKQLIKEEIDRSTINELNMNSVGQAIKAVGEQAFNVWKDTNLWLWDVVNDPDAPWAMSGAGIAKSKIIEYVMENTDMLKSLYDEGGAEAVFSKIKEDIEI